MSGSLYIVSTPIGNLEDISHRALSVLSKVDIIACEDTRVTRRLLSRYKIKNKLISYNGFNEYKMTDSIVEYLMNGKDIALVSDAGTPCISDPGYRLVNKSLIKNINVLSIPGPCSVHSALSISGLPSDSFFFQGFLPKKKGRKTKLEHLSDYECTIIIFESPKRVKKTLNDIHVFFGDRIISVCKEISKVYEKVFLDKVSNIIDLFEETNLKGEYVILISKKDYKLL